MTIETLQLLLPDFHTERSGNCLLVTVRSDRELKYLRIWLRDADVTAQWVAEKTVAVFFSRGNYSSE